jgi:hypothetical protein
VYDYEQGLLQGAQELADVFKIRRLIMQMQKNEPVTQVNDTRLRARLVAMPTWF